MNPDILKGRMWRVDPDTNRRIWIDPKAAREILAAHQGLLYLCELYTHVAKPTAGDLRTMGNKFLECLRIYKAESIEHARTIDVGKSDKV